MFGSLWPSRAATALTDVPVERSSEAFTCRRIDWIAPAPKARVGGNVVGSIVRPELQIESDSSEGIRPLCKIVAPVRTETAFRTPDLPRRYARHDRAPVENILLPDRRDRTERSRKP